MCPAAALGSTQLSRMALDGRAEELHLLEAGSGGPDGDGVQGGGGPSLADLCRPLNCRLCDVVLNSVQQGHAHYQGKSHSRKLRAFFSGSYVSEEPFNCARQVDCGKLCNAPFSSPKVSQSYNGGRKQAKKVRLYKTPRNKINVDGVTEPWDHPGAVPYCRLRRKVPRDLAMCVTPSGRYYCSMCDCGAEQESDFRRHLRGKEHQCRASDCLYRTEMEGLS